MIEMKWPVLGCEVSFDLHIDSLAEIVVAAAPAFLQADGATKAIRKFNTR